MFVILKVHEFINIIIAFYFVYIFAFYTFALVRSAIYFGLYSEIHSPVSTPPPAIPLNHQPTRKRRTNNRSQVEETKNLSSIYFEDIQSSWGFFRVFIFILQHPLCFFNAMKLIKLFSVLLHIMLIRSLHLNVFSAQYYNICWHFLRSLDNVSEPNEWYFLVHRNRITKSPLVHLIDSQPLHFVLAIKSCVICLSDSLFGFHFGGFLKIIFLVTQLIF